MVTCLLEIAAHKKSVCYIISFTELRMLTLKAKYKDGQITFMDAVPFSGEQDVLVTFLTSEDVISFSRDEVQELKKIIRESGFILTKRELQILRQAQGGMKIEDIAEKLGISSGTARNRLSSIYAKLKVNNRTEAIHKAIRLGLLDPVETVFDR